MEFYKKHISDLGNIVTGKTPRTSIHENYGGSIPFLTPTDDLSGKYVPRTIKTLTEKGLMEVKNCLLPSHSVCVSCIGSDLGKVVLTTEPTITNQQFNSIIPNKDNDVDFIYYLMSIVGRRLNILSKTSTAVPIINKSTFSDYEIEIPDIINQRKIATILSSLDEKIETNRRINDNLEQQAKAIFKSWFVDFEPFRDGEFVDSELGRIPQNWIVGTLRDLCVANKRTYNGKFVHEIQYIDTGSVTNNTIESIQTLNPVTDIIPSRARRAVTEGDIIYSSVRPNQKHYAFLCNPLPNTVVSTGFVVLTANWSGYRYYIYQYLIQDEIIDKLQSIAEQSVSTYPTLNASDLTNLKIVIPPNNVIGDFASLCHSYIAQIYKQQEESRRLAQLRDSLLPRLMSGELKVNEVTI